MSFEVATTLAVVTAVAVGLPVLRTSPDMVLLGGVAVLMVAGVLAPADALQGFANEGLATIAVLFVVAEGLRQTGGVGHLGARLLGRPTSPRRAQARLVFPIAVMSSMMNNTPVVAMAMPIVAEWAKKLRISVSHLLMPLSYASILGGLLTLIGTSTTIVVNGLIISETDLPGLSMFEIAWVGLPVAAVGVVYLLVASRWALPERTPAITVHDDPRQYSIELVVDPGALVDQTIEQAGLRHLPGAYLAEIIRGDRVIAAVGPHERLAAGDRLAFVGVLESVVDLQRTVGLSPATDQVGRLDVPHGNRVLVEAVVSSSCRYLGMTVRDAKFRSVYGAAIIAVARDGERVTGKIGDIQLQAGDTLLLQTDPAFVPTQRNNRDFFLVSEVADSTPPRHDRAWIARAILLGMVVLVTTEVLSMLVAAVAGAAGMLVFRCLRSSEAKRAIDWSVLLAIGAGLALGTALDRTGAARLIAEQVLALTGGNPQAGLAAVMIVTMALANVITTQAAAVLMFPVGVAAAANLGVAFMPFAIAIIVGAACSLATPIGYQTNLMVYGPGGYRTTDFVRLGLPLSILVLAVALTVIPVAWPL